MTAIGEALAGDSLRFGHPVVVAVDLAALDMQASAFDHEVGPPSQRSAAGAQRSVG